MALAARKRSRRFADGGTTTDVSPSSAANPNSAQVTALSFVPQPTAADATAAASGTAATPVSYTSSIPATSPNFGPIVAQTDRFGMPQTTPSATLANSAGQQVQMYDPGAYKNPLGSMGPGNSAATSSMPASSSLTSAQSNALANLSIINPNTQLGSLVASLPPDVAQQFNALGSYEPSQTFGGGGISAAQQKVIQDYYTNNGISTNGLQVNSGGLLGNILGGLGIKRGGAIKKQKMAGGGIPTSEAMDPYWMRQEARGMVHPEGLIKSMGGGRTDIHPIDVPAGSYVVPADVVSGLAEGNTMAGSGVIDKMMHSLPFGIQGGGGKHGPGVSMPHPSPPRPYQEPSDNLNALQEPVKRGGSIKRADGGNAPGYPLPQPKPTYLSPSMFPQPTVDQLAAALPPNVLQPAPAKQKKAEGGGMQQPRNGHGEMVPIVVAGGEHIIYPQTIMKKFGDLKKGHKILDQFVLKSRKKNVEDIRKLKPPKR